MKIKALLYLYKNGRKTPFSNGYRPLFNTNGSNYSGVITLIDRSNIHPGEKSVVFIDFINNNLILNVGDSINFSEDTRIILGKIEVLRIDKQA